MCGDFNLPNIKWNGLIKDQKTESEFRMSHEKGLSQLLINCLDKHLLLQIIEEPTRQNNILELICTNASEKISDISISPTILSDHNLIRVETTITNTNSNRQQSIISTNENKFQTFDFNNEDADWTKTKMSLQGIDWNQLLENKNVEEILETIENEVIKIIKNTIPLRKIIKKRRSNSKRLKQTLFRKKCKITRNLTITKNVAKKQTDNRIGKSRKRNTKIH